MIFIFFGKKGGKPILGSLKGGKFFKECWMKEYKLQLLWFSVFQNPIHHYFHVAIFVFAMQVCHSPQMLIQRWQAVHSTFWLWLFQNNYTYDFLLHLWPKTAFFHVKVWLTIEIITDFLFSFYRHFDIELQTTNMQKNSLRQL